MARTPLDLDELVEHWTLLKDEQALVSGKRGAARLGFAVLLKFYTHYGRFPRNRTELPGEAVEFVARKEAVLRTGCLDAVASVSGGGSLSPEVLAERLLLVIYAYGTNTGIKAVASGGHGHTEDELRIDATSSGAFSNAGKAVAGLFRNLPPMSGGGDGEFQQRVGNWWLRRGVLCHQ